MTSIIISKLLIEFRKDRADKFDVPKKMLNKKH
jgi:hypothetical protein